MIPGSTVLPIKRYWHLDPKATVSAKHTDEKIFGIPCGWYDAGQLPFIEHRRGNTVVKTVNCTDVAMIELDVPEG